MLSGSLAMAIGSVGLRHQWVSDFGTTHTGRLFTINVGRQKMRIPAVDTCPETYPPAVSEVG